VKRWQENGHEARHNARRAAIVQEARHKRGLLGSKRKKRDLDGVLNTSHNLTDLRFTPNTDHSTLFASINSCVLTPEVTQGPYCKSKNLSPTFNLYKRSTNNSIIRRLWRRHPISHH
jgi:hypothetical protein